MLYDNAQLARAYLHAWQLTDDARYRQVVEETLEFVLREMRTADGGFAASLDADTEGEEGATYVWSQDGGRRDPRSRGARPSSSAYDVTENGNWEGHTILRRVADGDEAALDAGARRSCWRSATGGRSRRATTRC